jgi:uncharacterized damage-inducible protein DinB
MSIKRALLNELKHESASTRKMLERVNYEKGTWKPHEKSNTLEGLAKHVANIPAWVKRITDADEFNFAGGFTPAPPVTNTEELLALHDSKVKEATESLEKISEEDLSKPFSLKNGEHVISTLPKAALMRSFAFNHLVHHRGQLSVYLRLLDIPVPGMYGPSADDHR